MNRNLLIALCLIVVGQILTFLQLQAQFFSTWVKNNIGLFSLSGVLISYILIKYTKYCAAAFSGEIWPVRLIGFAIGAIMFTLMAWTIMKEPVSTKTFMCLILSLMILGIQIFWK